MVEVRYRNLITLCHLPLCTIYNSVLTCAAHWKISWLVQTGKGGLLRRLSDLGQDDHLCPPCPQLTVPWPLSVLGLSMLGKWEKQRSWAPSTMTGSISSPSAFRGFKEVVTKAINPIDDPRSCLFDLKLSVSKSREIKQQSFAAS